MTKTEFQLPDGCGYRILRRLGSGGEGTVYLVSRETDGQLFAAKAVPNARAASLDRLQLEKLSHRSLPKVYELLTSEGTIWLIMEYVKGTRLDAAVRRGLSRAMIYEISSQLSAVLSYLHTRPEPVFHLDVKPSNLLLAPSGRLVLIDFGAALIGEDGSAPYSGLGTPGFAAPEQRRRDRQPDARSDVFGFGAVLYYCLFGKAPPRDAAKRSREKGWMGMRKLILKCLQEDPQKRYRDGKALSKAVRLCRAKKAVCPAALVSLFLIAAFFSFWHMPGDKRTESAVVKAEVPESVHEKSADPEERERNFSRLLRMAEGLGFEEASGCYEQAAALFPADSRWYLALLERILADGLFDEEEEEVLKQLLYRVPEGEKDTALDLLQKQAKDYSLVAYSLGNAYWYFYGGSGGKGAAASWFARSAKAGDGQSWDWLPSARILARISSYYEGLGKNLQADTKDYWSDLNALWAQYEETGEEAELKGKAAQELLSLLIMNAGELLKNDQRLEEAEQLLDEIEAFYEEEGANLREQEDWKKELTAARKAAGRVLKTTGGTNGETEE